MKVNGRVLPTGSEVFVGRVRGSDVAGIDYVYVGSVNPTCFGMVIRAFFVSWIAAFAVTGCARDGAEPPLMSYADYPDVTHSVPYVLQYENERSRGALLYYGSRHTNNAADPQVAEIQSLWESFRPTLALNEGGSPPAEKSLASAMQYGEAGLVRYLAVRDGVRVESLEPNVRVEFGRALKAGHSPTTVKIFWAMRFYVSYRRANPGDFTDEFMARALNQRTGHAALDGPPSDVAGFARSYAALFPDRPDWKTMPDEYLDPASTATVLNLISREVSIARDEHMVRLIADAVQRGERVFAVVGASHVVFQKSKLAWHLPGLTRPSADARFPLTDMTTP